MSLASEKNKSDAASHSYNLIRSECKCASNQLKLLKVGVEHVLDGL